jgi:hypothetical protein
MPHETLDMDHACLLFETVNSRRQLCLNITRKHISEVMLHDVQNTHRDGLCETTSDLVHYLAADQLALLFDCFIRIRFRFSF